MQSDREKWDRKYTDRQGRESPAAILLDHWAKAPLGRALDLACGPGRHSLYLAERGFEVDAVDISPVALAQVRHPRVRTLERDLDAYRPPFEAYDLVLDINFLDRALFAPIEAALRPGGLLIFETFLVESGHVGNPAFKLQPGELRLAFAALEVIHHEETAGRASLVARKSTPSRHLSRSPADV